MVFKDYYKTLSLETNRVSSEKIRNAYRMAAKKYHPDLNVEDKLSEEKIKDINEAYRVLSVGASRRKYDRMWNTHVGKKQIKQDYEESKRNKDSVFSDFFNMFFGTTQGTQETERKMHKKVPVKGDNVETEINVGIEDAYFGTEKKISLRTVNRKNENFFCKNTIWN